MENTPTDEQITSVRRAYFKNWRATHKENVRRHNQTYWRKKAALKAAETEVKSDDDNAKTGG